MISAIIQARMTSTRLPGKVLMPLDGQPALKRMIERVRSAKLLDDVIVATTVNDTDNPIIELCDSMGVKYFRGSEDDVVGRVLETAKHWGVSTIVELTGDCPLIDPAHIDFLVARHVDALITTNIDISGNIIGERTFPRGYDIRIFETESLVRAYKEIDNPIDRQHVGTWMYLNPYGRANYTRLNYTAQTDEERRPDIEVTLDTQEDYELLDWIFKVGREYQLELTCGQVVSLIDTYPDVYKKVAVVERKSYEDDINAWYAANPRKETAIISAQDESNAEFVPISELPEEPPTPKKERKPRTPKKPATKKPAKKRAAKKVTK